MTPTARTDTRPVPAWVAATAVAGTILIALGAFWLSFTTLADLARRSGVSRGWVWPIIVDGVIVVATISVVTLDQYGPRATRYPWILLIACASISVTANALHALVSSHTGIPSLLAAAVAAVPPLVLLAITHLTVELTRRARPRADEHVPPSTTMRSSEHPSTTTEVRAATTSLHNRRRVTGRQARAEAMRLRATGWTNKRIAAHLGVHPSTVGRWLTAGDHTHDAVGGDDAPANESIAAQQEPTVSGT